MDINNDEFLWSERYRPHTIKDCILPKTLEDMFVSMVKRGEVSNMIFSGTSGVGKTTVAKALCEDIGCDYIVVAGSEDTGIDVLRTKVRSFASSGSFSGKTKVVIYDEGDNLNPLTTQPALRGFIEEFSKNCRFIFTCNYKNRLIAHIHSRAPVVEFKIEKEDRPKMALRFMKRTKEILEAEGVEYNEKVVAQFLANHFPDYRSVLLGLQQYSFSGKIDEGLLKAGSDANIAPLIEALKEKSWKKMRTWITNNEDVDPSILFRKLFDSLEGQVKEIPQMVIILADYGYKHAFCADKQINVIACLTELMAVCSFNE